MNIHSLLLFLSLSCWFIQLQAQYDVSGVKTAIAKLEADPDMKSANWSICIKDVQTGKTIAAYQDSRSLSTASTMKVITTATALAILGGDFQFKTSIAYSGHIENGVLKGNLYIRGSGDPTLGSDRFDAEEHIDKLMLSWVNNIKAAGIEKVEGQVIADASIYGTQLSPGNWSWEDMGNYYGVGACGLNINENKYRLDFAPGSYAGGHTRVLRTEPYIDGLSFINEVRTGKPSSGDNAYIYGAPYTYLRYLRGTVPPGGRVFSIYGSMPDPGLFCAQYLAKLLDSCGIQVAGASSIRIEALAGKKHEAKRKTIFEHSSPSLSTIIEPLNMKSINLYAEALCKQLAIKEGKTGTTKKGAKVILDYWKGQGVTTKGMFVTDGSGLSRSNAMSTSQMAHILAKAHQASYGKDLYNSLPLAGRSGSLKNMLRGTRAEGNLRAKSGYIGGVRAYAGYVDTRSGKRLSFAVISNNYSCSAGRMRQKLARLMASLANIP